MRLLVLVLALSLVASTAEDSPAASGPQRVGVIHHGAEWHTVVDGLRAGLRAAGVEEGKHVVLDIRETKGDLQRARVEVILTASTSVSLAAKRATTQVPIVFFAGSDPVAAGLVESIAKPKLARVVAIYHPDNRSAQTSAALARGAARKMGVQLVERHVRSIADLRVAAQAISPQEFDAFFQLSDSMVTVGAAALIEAAREKRLPTMFHTTGLCDKGGLFCYGQNYHEVGRISAKLVQRVLAGTAPRDLPVENYDKLELVINRRTAKQIGVAIPATMLLRADRAIE
jgi:putative ABC transport system substrate-binding protein